MPNNTKARSNILRSIAEDIIKRENIDPTNPPIDRRAYIKEICQRGTCHIETARTVLNSVLGSLRWGRTIEAYPAWGGANRGQGRKKSSHRIQNEDGTFVNAGTDKDSWYTLDQARKEVDYSKNQRIVEHDGVNVLWEVL